MKIKILAYFWEQIRDDSNEVERERSEKRSVEGRQLGDRERSGERRSQKTMGRERRGCGAGTERRAGVLEMLER